MAATSILIAICAANIGSVYSYAMARPRTRAIALTALIVLALSQLSNTKNLTRLMYLHNDTLPGGPTRLAAAKVEDRIRSVEGDVLSVDHTLVVVAGKRLFYETRDMKRFYDRGLADPRPIVSGLEHAEVPLIVVRKRTHEAITGQEPGRGRFTADMLKWIRINYELDWSGGPYVVYARKDD